MKILYYLPLIIFLNLITTFSSVPKVQAGAGRQPLIPRPAPEPMPQRPSTSSSPETASASVSVPSVVPSNTRPLHWETSYWRNSMICRESQGNIICLNPEQAKKLRWSTPTPYQ